MAIYEPASALDEFHFEAEAFHDLLKINGAREAMLAKAMRCGCWDPLTGQPDPACQLCYPFGFIYEEPVAVAVFGPNRKPTRRFEQLGVFDPGDAWFTFPPGVTPPFASRIILPQSVIEVDDVLTKGKWDITRFGHVVELQRAIYSTRTPASGAPYTRENVDLTWNEVGADFTFAGRTVTWDVASAVPDGTNYVLKMKVYSEYICWDAQDRQEDGKPMPYRVLCKRLDYFKHPRSAADVSYPGDAA